ncbi:hypothetical protein [Quadrisphaera sp. INWT6]|uniref:hypothetical protein n=1 Tax=Quadrisphaera sp. INWT6 TaxID=2596917 RepID=UPI001892426B|nr:hypothetical protein [Quadrisphaera sp. INWT6]
MTTTPHPHLALLREAQDRALESEGIPMVLALLDHRVGTGAERAAHAEGQRLAAAMDDVRGALLPGHRGSDLGATTAVLQAVSYADFGRLP